MIMISYDYDDGDGDGWMTEATHRQEQQLLQDELRLSCVD